MNEKVRKTIKELLPYIIIVIVVLLIKTYIVMPVQVKGTSMEPTLRENEIMILNKVGYKLGKLKRFDIVVVKLGSERLIKRVIGLPGEVVKYEDNKLYINDEYIEEPFLASSVVTQNFQVKIENNYYFVLGDNREVSNDSRYFGAVNIKNIEGTTNLTVFPFNRFGIKK